MASNTSAEDECWPSNLREVWGRETKAVIKFLETEFFNSTRNKEYKDELETTQKQAKSIILEWWWKEKYGGDDDRYPSEYPKRFAEWLLEKYHASPLGPGDNRPSETPRFL